MKTEAGLHEEGVAPIVEPDQKRRHTASQHGRGRQQQRQRQIEHALAAALGTLSHDGCR